MFTICRVVPVAGGGSVQSSTIFLHKKMKVEQKKDWLVNWYLHDDTSHNVLEGLLELCEAVASKVINMRIARPSKHFLFESKSANHVFTLPNRIPQPRLSTDLLWRAGNNESLVFIQIKQV